MVVFPDIVATVLLDVNSAWNKELGLENITKQLVNICSKTSRNYTRQILK